MDDVLHLEEHWPAILQAAEQAQTSSLHFSVASVNPDGTPTITPIGTVFLRSDGTGYYFDTYTSVLDRNLDLNSNICVMAINSSRRFWFKSLLLGRFVSPPGFRLYGTAGPMRLATQTEISAVRQRTRSTRWLRGNQLLWNSFMHVRDLNFNTFRPVIYPVMMGQLWKDADV